MGKVIMEKKITEYYYSENSRNMPRMLCKYHGKLLFANMKCHQYFGFILICSTKGRVQASREALRECVAVNSRFTFSVEFRLALEV